MGRGTLRFLLTCSLASLVLPKNPNSICFRGHFGDPLKWNALVSDCLDLDVLSHINLYKLYVVKATEFVLKIIICFPNKHYRQIFFERKKEEAYSNVKERLIQSDGY